jgi:hypothetical protein
MQITEICTPLVAASVVTSGPQPHVISDQYIARWFLILGRSLIRRNRVLLKNPFQEQCRLFRGSFQGVVVGESDAKANSVTVGPF